MRSFRRRLQTVLKAASKVIPEGVARSLRSSNQEGRGSNFAVRAAVRLLEVGDFHSKGPFVTLDDRHLSFLGNDSVVTRTVYWHGIEGYEGGQVELWEKLCLQAKEIREIGANVGLYSVIGGLANPIACYQAYEPHPVVFRALYNNVALNRITNVQLFDKAVVPADSGRPLQVQLQMFDQDVDWHHLPTGGSVADVVGVNKGVSENCISVPAVSAQDVFAGADLIKLDVEGAEGLLLTDAEMQILATRPVILLECLPGTHGLSSQLMRLHAAGFSLVSPVTGEEQEALDIRPPRRSTSAFVTRDRLLVPSERLDFVKNLIAGLKGGESR